MTSPTTKAVIPSMSRSVGAVRPVAQRRERREEEHEQDEVHERVGHPDDDLERPAADREHVVEPQHAGQRPPIASPVIAPSSRVQIATAPKLRWVSMTMPIAKNT